VITVLSGGVGAARLLRALLTLDAPEQLTAVVNVGDDLTMHGLTICPDLDTITYTLAGLNNDELGWGLRGESWRVMEQLEQLGGDAWFRLGDLDLATHLYRSQRLSQGATKTEVAAELAAHYNLTVRLLPATNDHVATEFVIASGRLSFQDYFVRQRHDVEVKSVEFVGVDSARVTPEVETALREARRIVIAPSNPLISIEPILQLPGLRAILRERATNVVAVSPLVDGKALKGPAERLLRELGYEPSCLGVARYYGDLVGTWIIDEADEQHASAIENLGHRVIVTTTVMADASNARRLAGAVSE